MTVKPCAICIVSHHLQKFPPTPFIYHCYYYFVTVCDKNTFVIYPLSRF